MRARAAVVRDSGSAERFRPRCSMRCVSMLIGASEILDIYGDMPAVRRSVRRVVRRWTTVSSARSFIGPPHGFAARAVATMRGAVEICGRSSTAADVGLVRRAACRALIGDHARARSAALDDAPTAEEVRIDRSMGPGSPPGRRAASCGRAEWRCAGESECQVRPVPLDRGRQGSHPAVGQAQLTLRRPLGTPTPRFHRPRPPTAIESRSAIGRRYR